MPTEKSTPRRRRAAEEPAGGQSEPRPATRGKSARKRIPPRDPNAIEIKRFIVATDLKKAPLVVSVSNGPIAKDYAPAALVAKVAEKVTALLKDLGGGFEPMLYGMVPGSSMTLVFGDPLEEDAQGQLGVDVTHPQALRVLDLISATPDEIYTRALTVGAPALRYNELTQVLASEGVTMTWAPARVKPRTLTSVQAQAQHVRLSRPGPTVDREIRVNGVLYRVIAEPREGHLGTVGIRLHTWSTRLPGRPTSRRIIAVYNEPSVEEAIKDGLIGEPVEAVLTLRQPVAGSSLTPNDYDVILSAITEGDAERSTLPRAMFDIGDEIDDLD